ncbi:MAG: hypothetical protein ABW318_09950 [Vicinamibacterales bacterium]
MNAAETPALARLSTQSQETHYFRDLVLATKLTTLRTRRSLLRDDFVDAEPRTMVFFGMSCRTQTAHSWGGTLCFVYLPRWASVATATLPNRGLIHPETDRQWRSEVLAIVNDLHLPLIDLSPAFRADRDPLVFFPFRRMGHYNENGHRFVANELQSALRTLFSQASDER